MNGRRLLITMAAMIAVLAAVPVATAFGRSSTGNTGKAVVLALTPVGSGFTYQGRLTDAGSPANAAYDFRFILYDADTGGAQVGTTQNANDVAVANGLFTTALDFGAAAFDGNARWLEIAVRPGASTGSYTVLNPRQPITATPYAMYAKSAGSIALPWVTTVSSTGPGISITNTNTGSATASGVTGETNSLAGNVAGVVGRVTATSPGGYSAGVRGINEGTAGNGIGVYGSQQGSGWGVYGVAPAGRGVYGESTTGAGIYGTSSSGNAGVFVGDVQVSGEINKTYGSTPSQAVPIAFGYVNAAGALVSGTGNVSATLVGTSYRITIAGEPYFFSDYIAIVTPIDSPRIPKIDSVSNTLKVDFVDLAGLAVTSRFQFVVFKP